MCLATTALCLLSTVLFPTAQGRVLSSVPRSAELGSDIPSVSLDAPKNTTYGIPGLNISSDSEPDVIRVAGGTWDPNDLATQETLTYYEEKGAWLNCLLEMTDGVAGQAWPDPLGRTPASASSQWKGTLQSKCHPFNYCHMLYTEG